MEDTKGRTAPVATIEDYNHVRAHQARADALMRMAALSLADNMHGLVQRLIDCGVVAPGTVALKRSLIEDE